MTYLKITLKESHVVALKTDLFSGTNALIQSSRPLTRGQRLHTCSVSRLLIRVDYLGAKDTAHTKD